LQVRALPDPPDHEWSDEQLMAMQEQIGKVRDAVPRTVNFLSEVWAELKKVHWPTRKETYAATIVVLVVTAIIAIFLGVVDFAISHVVQVILG
jgi:preprotein translocase subunit SecE